MEREIFVKNFGLRLLDLMQQADLKSEKSKAKVKVTKLAEISQCSVQMARKYVMGEALPDVNTIYKIARWLNVSPGWLLFGEESKLPDNISQKNLVIIENDLLKHILAKSINLVKYVKDTNELVNFITDVINDTTQIEANEETILKLIDISINSAMRFHEISLSNT